MTKALTLSQPWATLVALGVKRIETRSWRTSHRGRLLIHAAAGKSDRNLEWRLAARKVIPSDLTGPGMPLGAFVAIAQLVDIVRIPEDWQPSDALEAELGDYRAGRFAWMLSDVFPLVPPAPARGALGLWDGPDL